MKTELRTQPRLRGLLWVLALGCSSSGSGLPTQFTDCATPNCEVALEAFTNGSGNVRCEGTRDLVDTSCPDTTESELFTGTCVGYWVVRDFYASSPGDFYECIYDANEGELVGAKWSPRDRPAQIAGAQLPASCGLSNVCETRFDPSGCDVHVRGRWQVDDQDPDAETCGNIAIVELTIVNEAEDQFWVPAPFALRCDPTKELDAVVIDGGAYVDTRLATGDRCGGTGEILSNPPAGEYKTRWRATDDLRFIVDCSPIEARQVTPIDGGTGLLLDVGTVNLRTGPAGSACPTP